MLEPREQRGRQQRAWDCEVGADRAAHLRRHALLPPRRFMLREHRRADDEIAVRSEQLLESSGCQPRDRAEKRPLVRPRLERLRIEEDACARGSAASLQRQRDQVAESFLRQEVLIGEEPVVARQVDLGPPGHRVAQQQCAEPPRRAGSDRRREEIQTWPPLPERLHSNAADTPCAPHASSSASASSCHVLPSKSQARNQQVSSSSSG